MGRNDFRLIGDIQRIEDICCVFHGFPVRLASHDDADDRGLIAHVGGSVCGRFREGPHYMMNKMYF